MAPSDTHVSVIPEIKKIIFWDLDKRLRISAGVALWPAATGDAPVRRQSPTDEVLQSLLCSRLGEKKAVASIEWAFCLIPVLIESESRKPAVLDT